MRYLFLVAAAVVLVSYGSSGFSEVSALGPKSFAVAGGGQVTADGEKHFSISAHDGPNGPSGHVVMSQTSICCGPFTLQGHVACVSVSGNRATIGVNIEKGTGTAVGQTGILLFVEDNGNGSSGAADEFTNSGYVGDASVCPAPIDPTTPITSGNINVKDAS